jgi:glycosyltransferase involved in cell wall biosynthesis
MKVLLSAYACEPVKGSEPGVGWNWALTLAGAGHEVTVLTRENNRAVIASAVEPREFANLSFVYYDLPRWARWWKKGGRGVYLYYLLWQFGAYRKIRRTFGPHAFDLVQHITFGSFRYPSFMWRLGIPLIFGPAGGGETTPRLLMQSYPLRGRIADSLRALSTFLTKYDPLVQLCLRHAAVIFCATKETLACVPKSERSKCAFSQSACSTENLIQHEPSANPSTPRFLYVGRLLYWKGIHLALQAFAQVLQRHPESVLTIHGRGPERQWLHEMAERLGVAGAVNWSERNVTEEQLRDLYREHTSFIFPSMHDSCGAVVMEALAQGLPVICLDTGGPGQILPNQCGFKIEVAKRSQAEVVSDLASTMLQFAENPDLRKEMSPLALRAAREITWDDVVSRAYRHIHETLAIA